MPRKKLLSLLILLLLVSTILRVNKVGVSATPLSPYIMVVPDKTVDSTLTPGMNYTISIYTDYDGSDVWGWKFSLTFNPEVLEGISVSNGDLITRAKNTTSRFYPGAGFDNTQGTLSEVAALFYYTGTKMAYTTSGPGTLANVTFTVVGIGIANITLAHDPLGANTMLKGNRYETEPPGNIQYPIIDASLPPGATEIPYGSDHIGHGYFNNIPPIHDVAVIMNYTAAIYTDYNGSNICAWQFNLTFNPTILEGIEVRNGDLITTAKHDNAQFTAGTFNNTAGILSFTNAYFGPLGNDPHPTTSGPGTLAYVTFNVKDTGDSNITLGSATQLFGVNRTALPAVVYTITEANIFVTPLTALPGDVVSINVGVVNEGNFTETLDVAAYVNDTLIETQTVTSLASGSRTLLTFNWNTTGIAEGNYAITANATVLPSADNPTGIEEDPTDNTRATLMKIKTARDVAIINLVIPTQGTVGDLVPINVTVTNQGTFEENVNLTIYYQPFIPQPPEFKIANTTNVMLAERPASKTIQVNWNTTGLEAHTYKIKANVTIDKDEDLSDNTILEQIPLKLGHDVAVTALSATPTTVFVGETVTISVKVQNVGGINETLLEVKVTCAEKDIGSKQVQSLTVGNSTTLLFSWNTTGVDPNIYQIKAEVILETDADPTNNQRIALVVVAEPIGHIAGTVKDASTGNPIEGVTVTAGTYSNTTNADGYYELSNVLAGNYTITASKNGYQTSSKTSIKVVAGQTTSLNFTLTPLPTTGHITGTVTDASTGNPIEGAQVSAGSHSVSTNATGNYSIELAAGTYNVTVSAEGYESSSETDVNVVAGATTTKDFELTPIQSSNIFLYAAAVVGVIIVIAGIAVYLRKGRKTT